MTQLHIANTTETPSAQLTITDEQLEKGVGVFGSIGTGKSRFLLHIILEHLRLGRGLTVVDPGDLVDDFLARIARRVINSGKKGWLRKINVIELSPARLARMDPFRYRASPEVPPGLEDVYFKSWQHTRVQETSEAYQWKQGQSNFEGFPRVQRMFTNTFTAVSTPVGNQRLSAADADRLVDRGSDLHLQAFDRLRDKLPREIVADFEILHGFKSLRDLRQETESFINRIRSMHGPLLKEMQSTSGLDEVFDMRGAIERGEITLIKVAKSPYASSDQNYALAAICINALYDTVYSLSRQARVAHTLMVDEFHKFKNLAMVDNMRTSRKYKLGLILATTDLASLRTPDRDFAAELLSVMNTIIAFRMSWPADIRLMAEVLFAKNLQFRELIHEVERRNGIQWIPVDEWSESVTRQTSTSRTESNSSSIGDSRQQTTSRSNSAGTSKLDSTVSANRPRTVHESASTGRNESIGHSESTGHSQAESSSEGESRGVTVNHKWVHIDRIEREKQLTGRLEQATSDQISHYCQMIATLPQRHAFVRIGEGEAVPVTTLDVPDAFAIPEAHYKAIEWIKQALYEVHGYYFTPTLDPQNDTRRIEAFINGGPSVNGQSTNGSSDHASPLL